MPFPWAGAGPSYPERDSIMPSAWAASAKSVGRRCPFSEVREDSRVTIWDSRVDLAFSRFSLGVAYEAGLIDIDKSDTVYGNDSRMVGYKNVRNRCFLIRTGVNF